MIKIMLKIEIIINKSQITIIINNQELMNPNIIVLIMTI